MAKELGLKSSELKEILHAHGIKIASHLSSIDPAIAENIRREVKARRQSAAAAASGDSGDSGGSEEGGANGKKPAPKPAPKITPKPAAARRPLLVRSKTPTPPPREQRRRPPRPGGGGGGREPRPELPNIEPPVPDEGGRGRGRGHGHGHGHGGGGGGGGGGGHGHGGRRVRVFPGQGQFRSDRSRPRGPTHSHRPGGRKKGGRRGGRDALQRPQRETLAASRPSEVTVELPITLKELSSAIGVKVNMIIQRLLGKVMLTVNTHLSDEILQIIGEEFEVKIETSEKPALESTLEELDTKIDEDAKLEPRAPVVTFLGHVDHGKTSLLDKIRETRVVTGEAGGITQHLSAYRVDSGDKHVVFIDTPGHEAFTEMRARGANVTDVVVLLVAADDGVMPQTEEAIQHARAGGVPIVVAINKIDKPNANVMRTKEQLSKLDLAPPDWGGTTEMVELSAITGEGIDALLEILSLETELLDLKANPDKGAIGTVLDAKATPGRGNIVTVLVQDGALRPGDSVVCGSAMGRVRHLQTTTGIHLEVAGPATPVELSGLDELPEAGDRLYVLETIQKAKEIAEDRKRKKREAERARRQHVTLDGLFEHLSEGDTKEVNLILKADVKGSLEVLRKQLTELSTDEVRVKVLLTGVGEITESDVTLADASDAIIIGFHVVPGDRARKLAEERAVEIRIYQVIYQVIEEMKLSLEGLLEPELYEEVQASVEIREMFRSSRLGNIAGCMVKTGNVRREDPVRLIRDGKIIFEGKLDSLKRFKDDTNEVKEGFECGLRIAGFNDIKVGDVVQSYKVLKKTRTFADAKPEKK